MILESSEIRDLCSKCPFCVLEPEKTLTCLYNEGGCVAVNVADKAVSQLKKEIIDIREKTTLGKIKKEFETRSKDEAEWLEKHGFNINIWSS